MTRRLNAPHNLKNIEPEEFRDFLGKAKELEDVRIAESMTLFLMLAVSNLKLNDSNEIEINNVGLIACKTSCIVSDIKHDAGADAVTEIRLGGLACDADLKQIGIKCDHVRSVFLADLALAHTASAQQPKDLFHPEYVHKQLEDTGFKFKPGGTYFLDAAAYLIEKDDDQAGQDPSLLVDLDREPALV